MIFDGDDLPEVPDSPIFEQRPFGEPGGDPVSSFDQRREEAIAQLRKTRAFMVVVLDESDGLKDIYTQISAQASAEEIFQLAHAAAIYAIDVRAKLEEDGGYASNR